MSFTINPDDKWYPQANEWMWNYCTFLGKFTDSRGVNYDLGVYIDYYAFRHDIKKCVFDATVHSNQPGDYSSGEFRDGEETREFKLEVYRRAKILNLIP